jgi:hypothetical protein
MTTAIEIADLIGNEVVADIRYHSSHSKRSLQKSMGASDISNQCPRRLAYKILDVPKVNDPDPWFTIIGSAVHKWMADCYTAKNKRLGSPRYLIEKRVSITKGVGGSFDLYDSQFEAIIDWKVVGDSAIKRAKADSSTAYNEQLSLYADSLLKRGIPVKWIVTFYLPRNGFLRTKFVDVQKFKPAVAQVAVERYKQVNSVVNKFGSEAPYHLPGISAFCDYCPFFMPASTDYSAACPGADLPTQPKAQETRAA